MFRKRTYRRRVRPRTQRRRTVRRSTYRKRRSYNAATPYVKTVSGVPERMFTKLRYVDCITSVINVGVVTNPVTFQTSLSAPRTSGGHQPLYYDQWTQMYYKYRVYGISYNFTFINKSTVESVWVILRHQDVSAADSGLQTILERRDSRSRFVAPIGSSRNVVTIKGYMSTAKATGYALTSIKNDDQFQANFNTNPALMAYLAMYLSSTGSSGTVTLDITCRMTYHCELFLQVPVAAS